MTERNDLYFMLKQQQQELEQRETTALHAVWLAALMLTGNHPNDPRLASLKKAVNEYQAATLARFKHFGETIAPLLRAESKGADHE